MSGADMGASQKNVPGEDAHNAASPARAQLREPYLVLIVDDEAPIAESLAFIVGDAGYTPLVATQGNEALALTHDRWPALVFTDLMMPQMNGTKFIATLRGMAASDGHAMPSIVLMTAAGPKPAETAGADLILHKPFELLEVEALLQRFLGPPPQK